MTYVNKTTILFSSLLLLLGSCRHSDKEFQLKGELQNIYHNEFYLFGTEPPFNRIDTIRLNEDGSFSYQTELDTITHFTMLYNRGEMLPIFADKGLKVSIKGDASDPDSIFIRGGEQNEELNLFNERIHQYTDSLQVIAEADSFICHHPFSKVSIYLLDKYFIQTPHPNYKRTKELIESMSGLLHDDPLVESIEKKLDNAIKSDTGRYVSNFRMKDWKKENLTSHTFRNKVVVILFWASWDKLSSDLYTKMMEWQKKYKKEETVDFIYFSLDSDKKQWEEAVKGDSLTGHQVCDGEGWASSQVKLFGIERLPSLILLNPQRKIVNRQPIELEELSVRVDSLIKLEKTKKNKSKKK